MSPLYLEGISLDAGMLKGDGPNGPDAEQMIHERKRDERAFYLLFMLSFPLFLMAALAGRLLPGKTVGSENGGQSIIAEASATTRSTIAIGLTN